MPARNALLTIRAAVDSVTSIMRGSDELIVVDDASTDGTSEFLSQYTTNHRNVRIFRNSSQLGVAKSLNAGLARSSQSYVGRIDADDICLPWRRSIDVWQMSKGCDLGFSSSILFGPGMRWPLPQWSLEVKPDQLLPMLAVSNPFVHSTMVARKSSLEALGGYAFIPAEDYDLWIRAAEAGFRFTRSAIPKILYRVHPGQLTAQEGWQVKSEDLPVRDELLRKLSLPEASQRESLLGKIARLSRR